MAYDFEVRVNGVIKMANQITDIPSFFFDGKKATIVAELTEEPPELDVPRLNPQEIQDALDAEGESPEGSDQGAEEDDGESSQLDDKPRRKGGRRKGGKAAEEADPNTDPDEASNEEIASAREEATHHEAPGAEDADPNA